MKGFLCMGFAAMMLTGAAFAGNMENPLYLPSGGEFYSKSGMGLMYKRSDHTEALVKKGMDGKDEFPIWRFNEDFGYGITDRLAAHARIGWTQDDSINRKGMHRGRVGLTYRVLTEEQSPIIWDVYGEAYLSALMPMKGSFNLKEESFTYDNYSNGRWGVYAGTKLGKVWGNFTLSAYAEYLQTFGNHNNKIKINSNGLVGANIPDEISVDLASTHEINAGINTFVQLSKKWSVGGGFEFIEHRDNSVAGIHTKITEVTVPYFKQIQQRIINGLLAKTADMDDGWNEYILKAVGAYQMTDTVQFAVFAEYTFDTSHPQSQNGTDIKAEAGARVNIAF